MAPSSTDGRAIDPDNYTDEETFLDHLQRNPRLQPYDFWPLVADSMTIVQQVCTMIIFVCCFSCIVQDRISPVTIVSWSTASTVFGWVLWDIWVGQEEAEKATVEVPDTATSGEEDAASLTSASSRDTHTPMSPVGLGLSMKALRSASNSPRKRQPRSRATSSNASTSSLTHPHQPPSGVATSSSDKKAKPPASDGAEIYVPLSAPSSPLSPRTQQRLATLKSALLIYMALLGLSPILKSLTQSTASDSIWAMAFWLMCINVVFFDYSSGVTDETAPLEGGGGSAKFPASLSTNAALMASTVLASRLRSITHVFSLTLFSIEVFGLFPIFRRYLRHFSWRGHLALTWALVMGAGGGTAICMGEPTAGWPWQRGIVGVLLGCVVTSLAMGMCSWWLIGLQRYKNEIHGPWDPARPVIRRQWD